MKRTVKKTSSPADNLIETEEPKGKTISIYLNAESLRYLDQLCKLFKAGRSKVIQDLILQMKKFSLVVSTTIPEDKSELADMIRKMAYGSEGVKL